MKKSKLTKKIIPLAVLGFLGLGLCVENLPIQKVYADSETWDFSYTGQAQIFTLPYTGRYTLEVWGASGGADSIGIGGKGGYAKGDINLSQGQTLYVYSGGQGTSNVAGTGGGFNGGGNAGSTGTSGAGGGATDIRLDGQNLSNRIIVAGGGGGAGNDYGYGGTGGDGGGLTGGNGSNWTTNGATQTSGGTSPNGNGSLGQGANHSIDGGGGGGGYYGGGAGGNRPDGNYDNGGGGGSAYLGGVSNSSTTPGINVGNGKAKITYYDTVAPTINISQDVTEFTGNPVTITATAIDNFIGVQKIQTPDGNWVNSSTINYTVSKNGSYTFKAIDNNGNEAVKTYTVSNITTVPTLNLTPIASSDYIHLDWGVTDTFQPYSFKVFQKKEGATDFQSVSTSSLKSSVKVLNTYPTIGDPITFTNWKGQTFTLPRSASFKMWMEQPNIENSKGYGMGLIDVDAVSINEFNNNPNYYLKNSDGTWKYDAVFEGAWDWNGAYDPNNPTGQLNANSLPVVESFINSGRGYLMGHDTLVGNNPNGTQYDYKLRKYFNIEVTGIDYPQYSDSYYGNNKVNVMRKGLLTNYPWSIGNIGSTLTVPFSHVLQQFTKGDVWLSYADEGHQGNILPTYNGSTNNFYLVSWNNTAMIQTGHSNGQATPDEQKVLANTIFYLSQLTSDTKLDDHSGQDVKAPTKPIVTGVNLASTGKDLTVNFTASTDQGSNYDYYVEANGQNNGAKTVSPIKSTTITSGLKGYSIVVDNDPNTIPDNVIETTSTSYIANNIDSTKTLYIHIRAVDNVGNVSDTVTYSDTIAPTLSAVKNPSSWTNSSVTLNVTATDNLSGVYGIRTPDNNWITGNGTSYTVSSNGTYNFGAKDNMGNIGVQSFTVSNIDVTAPTATYTRSTSQWVSDKDTINITATDTQSGVKRIKLPDGTYVNGSTATYSITKNGSYLFIVEDNVGNILNYPVNVNNITYKPVLNINPIPQNDYIKLDWSISDTTQPYTYKIFQQKNHSGQFQSVSASALKDGVKVLNIYPNSSGTVSFTNWKGESYTLPKGASLKQWMEQPNADDAKGYGKGLISVDPVYQNDFNINPSSYLKNSDGTWKYDVVFIGSWDCNGSCDIDGDLSADGSALLAQFIQSGRGFITGHDTISTSTHPNMNSLRSYLNVKVAGLDVPSIGYVGSTSGTTVQLKINKKGLLTNYPWNIGDVGTILTVPNTHTSGQYIYGDIWLKFNLPDLTTSDGGEANSYLTTWNNTALIQTGHNNGNATADEQKVLANTLFYLSQLTSATNLDDHSGQDITAPIKPTVIGVKLDPSKDIVNISYNSSVDQGTPYSYYVEANGQNNGAKTNSDIKSTTITSGIKGYSYSIDTNPNTVPDNVVDTTSLSLNLPKPSGTEIYFHIRAVDNVGNASDTTTYKVEDFTPPVLNLSLQGSWTNGTATILATATDNDSGVKSIKLPNGNIVTGSSATYTVGVNGVYYFEAIDNIGNKTTNYIIVDKIDTSKPKVQINNNQNWTNSSGVSVTITASDQ